MQSESVQEQPQLLELPWTRKVGERRYVVCPGWARHLTHDFLDKACEAFIEAADLGKDPNDDLRLPDIPVGLRVCKLPLTNKSRVNERIKESWSYVLRQCFSPSEWTPRMMEFDLTFDI